VQCERLLIGFKVLKDKHWKNVAQGQTCLSSMMTTRKRKISLMIIIKIIKTLMRITFLYSSRKAPESVHHKILLLVQRNLGTIFYV